MSAGCSASDTSQRRQTLVVFAAASLAEALEELAISFQKENPQIKVSFNFAGSQQLRTQLEHGAKADVFASADHKQMDRLRASGLLLEEPVYFVTNRLAVIVPKSASTGEDQDTSDGRHPLAANSPAGLGGAFNPGPRDTLNSGRGTVQTLEDLARKGVKLALALPEVPAGSYARTVIQNLAADPSSPPGYAQLVLANVVSQEFNVRSVAYKVALGEVDAGIVYWSDAQVEYVARRVRVLAVPERHNVVASYPVARLKGSDQPKLARAFVQLLLSPQGQNILGKHGFSPLLQEEPSPAPGSRGG